MLIIQAAGITYTCHKQSHFLINDGHIQLDKGRRYNHPVNHSINFKYTGYDSG